MKTFALTSLTFILLGMLTASMNKDPYDYEKAWKVVERLRESQLPESALKKIIEIYGAAMEEGNHQQQTRAIFHRAELTLVTQEDGVEQVIAQYEEALERVNAPWRNILASQLAGFYLQYFERNRYAIGQRTAIGDADDADVRSMSSQAFIARIQSLYLSSMEDRSALDLPVSLFKELLRPEWNEAGERRRPTLYLILAQQYLDYLSRGEMRPTLPSTRFILVDEAAFAVRNTFLSASFATTDSASFLYRSLLLYQDVLSDMPEGSEADVALDMQRLQFVRAQYTGANGDGLYRAALDALVARAAPHAMQGEVIAALASEFAASESLSDKTRAVDLCDQVLTAFPGTWGALQCHNIREDLLQKQLTLTGRQVYTSSESLRWQLAYRNTPTVQLRLYRVPVEALQNQRDGQSESLANLIAAGSLVKQWGEDLSDTSYITLQTELHSRALSRGSYLLVADADLPSGAWLTFQVSDIALVSSKDPQNRAFVVDRQTGRALHQAKVTLYRSYYDYQNRKLVRDKVATRTTARDGSFRLLPDETVTAEVSYRKDFLWSEDAMYPPWELHDARDKQVELYTDRAIYRPGQDVYFKGLCLSYDQDRIPRVRPGEKIEITLRDANYRELHKMNLQANAFGSFHGKFSLPTGTLTGTFTLSTSQGSRQIRVEEYKRPTFEIGFDPMEAPASLGDTLRIDGRAIGLAGHAISGSDVRYEVYRQLFFPRWCWFPPYPSEKEMIDAGMIQTDERGAFAVAFTTKSVPTGDIRGVRYGYTIELAVTDPSGETRTATHYRSLLDTEFMLRIQAPEQADILEPASLRIQAELADGTPHVAEGSLEVVMMRPPDRKPLAPSYPGRRMPGQVEPFALWTEQEVVYRQRFEAGQDFLLSQLRPGVYKLKATATDGRRREVKDETYLIVTNRLKGVYPPVKGVFVHFDKDVYTPGDRLLARLGVSDPVGEVFYMITREGKVLQEGWERIREGAQIRFAVTEADRGGISLQLFHVKNNEVTTESHPIEVPWTDKELDIVYETFRDKTLPGADETYQIRISPRRGESQVAELLMTMYDASLDQFTGHQWRRMFYPYRYQWGLFQGLDFSVRTASAQGVRQELADRPEPVRYPELRGFVRAGQHMRFGGIDGEMMLFDAQPRQMEAAPAASGQSPEGMAIRGSGDKAGQSMDDEEGSPADGPAPPATAPPVPPRTVLNETVFFFPDIRTAADGSITVSFRMNEALTRWRLMTLAHTKDLQVGYDERTVTTSKDLMILPNSPRFLKSGDALWFSARVANMSDRDLPYTASLTLLNDLDETNLNAWVVDSEDASGKIPGGQTRGIRWLIKVPEGTAADLLRYTVTVRSGAQADAEQNVLPILSSLVQVIETRTLFLRGGTREDIRFEALQKANQPNRINKLFTIEYTANPVWQAVQALPYIKPQSDQSTVSLINQYFANKLGQDILRKHPLIERVFRQWEREGGEALMSRLSRNKELKTMLIQETPWVVDALAETEQRAAIAGFFNSTMLQNELGQLARQLSERQSPNGGFMWMPGGRDSEFITNYLLTELGQLQHMGIAHDLQAGMIRRAVQYIDQRISERHQRIRKGSTGDYVPGPFEVSVLYMRSHYPAIPYAGEAGPAYTFFKTQAAKHWATLDIHSQALLGRTLYREEDDRWLAIRQSLTERSFYQEDRGRYFNVGSGYQWHELSIERHAAVLDFMVETEASDGFIDEMKIWLLNHKRVNRWQTTKATAAVIYTLLQKGTSRQSALHVDVKSHIRVAGQDLSVEDHAQSATGYFKQQWSGKDIRPALGSIQMENQADHIAWGGLYYQYLLPGDQVESHGGGPLGIRKEFYRIVTSTEGEKLLPLTADSPLQVGDILVSRLVIRADRDMQFVDIKDMRGAGIEPIRVLSGYRWEAGLGYYHSVRDIADHFFIHHLRKGTYVLENRLRVVHRGQYDAGIASIQSSYAPEFSAHSQGFSLDVR